MLWAATFIVVVFCCNVPDRPFGHAHRHEHTSALGSMWASLRQESGAPVIVIRSDLAVRWMGSCSLWGQLSSYSPEWSMLIALHYRHSLFSATINRFLPRIATKVPGWFCLNVTQKWRPAFLQGWMYSNNWFIWKPQGCSILHCSLNGIPRLLLPFTHKASIILRFCFSIGPDRFDNPKYDWCHVVSSLAMGRPGSMSFRS